MFIIHFLLKIIAAVSDTVTALFFIRPVYAIIGFFTTRKFPPAKKQHKYAILIAARNEDKVIGHLLDSIHAQDYPSELITVFVVADNCNENDHTAEIASSMGAICYKRNDTKHRTKGFALQYLVSCIDRDYGISSFEGYFIFDADNLLKEDFVSRMNESFDAGEKIVTSYRNTKNFGDNWISASYGIHWLRTIRFEHRARSFFHLATRIQGTGFLFSHEIIKDGWNYTGLTEDRAFCADAVANGYKISFNNQAEFFDEQPVDIKIAMRQRIRWAKGHLQAFTETGGKLFSHIFVTHGAANKNEALSKGISVDEIPVKKQFINNIRLRFMSYDMLTIVFPRALISSINKILKNILKTILFIAGALSLTLGSVLLSLVSYLSSSVLAAYVYFTERKRITKIKWYKKIWFCLTFPIFDIIGNIAILIALFIKVEWKPIPHNKSIGLKEIKRTRK